MTRLLGAVLAGGLSRRFGSDKSQALLEGRSLLDHAITALQPQVDQVVVCGHTRLGHVCLPDRPRNDLGPLGGLAAALRYGLINRFDAVVTVGCDTPKLPGDLVSEMSAQGECVCITEIPILGLWPTAMSAELDRFLARGGSRAMRAWAAHMKATPLVLPVAAPNINTPIDLEQLATALAA